MCDVSWAVIWCLKWPVWVRQEGSKKKDEGPSEASVCNNLADPCEGNAPYVDILSHCNQSYFITQQTQNTSCDYSTELICKCTGVTVHLD